MVPELPQFWGTQPDDTYAVFENTYLQVEGTLDVEGTVDQPVVLKPSDLFPLRGVVIDNRGTVKVRHAELYNLSRQYYEVSGYENRSFEYIDHSLISRVSLDSDIVIRRTDGGNFRYNEGPTFGAKAITNSRLYRLGTESLWAREIDNVTSSAVSPESYFSNGGGYRNISWMEMETSLIDGTYLSPYQSNQSQLPKVYSSVFLNNNQTWVNASGDTVTQGSKEIIPRSNQFSITGRDN